jgi:segregation and condensation protein B
MENTELKKVVETLLFITDQPIPLARICEITEEKDSEKISGIIAELRREYDEQGRGMQVIEIAEGFQMATRQDSAPFIRKLYADKMAMRLSAAALETLSIISYKQPLTRAEIEEIRGVEVIAALESLLDKRLVKVVGRKETVGRPLLYGTTPDFLRHFGLRSIEDLPPLDSFKVPEPAAAAGSPEISTPTETAETAGRLETEQESAVAVKEASPTAQEADGGEEDSEPEAGSDNS